jgi:ABC-type antimicrobial peptide transport system permease subunit
LNPNQIGGRTPAASGRSGTVFFGYLWKELRRRRKQAIVVSLGLGLGIGLVVAVSAMASGVQQAQASVLHSLYGVGTDISVTHTEDQGSGPGGFQVAGRDGPGFSRDQIVSTPGDATFAASEAAAIADLDGVSKAAGGLNLSVIHVKGKLPTFTPGDGKGGVITAPSTQTQPGRLNVASYSIAGVDVTATDVGPLSSVAIKDGRSFTSSDAKAFVAILDESYARGKGLGVGDTFKIDGTTFTVVGIAGSTAEGSGSDVSMPLARAQALAGEKGKVNTVYVKASGSSAIATARKAIAHAYPDATVSTASDLAKQVTGSLSSASDLATKLGSWLSIAALVAAIALASLLTFSAVGRRVRELGTLKALGWRTPRVVGQVMGESLVQGLVGGALGIGLGTAAAWVVTRVAPELTANVSAAAGGPTGSTGPGGGPFAQAGDALGNTVSVVLHAPVSAGLVATAIGLSLAGGVVAGVFGGWRAARLRPADAMRQVV